MMNSETIQKIRSYYEPMNLKRRIYFRAKIRFAKVMEKVEALLPKDGTILDLGCGSGIFDIYLRLASPERKIIGMDTDKWKMETLLNKTKELGIDFRVNDINSTSIPHADAILLYDVIHHIDKNKHIFLFQKCRDALDKGGKLIIKDIELKGFFGSIIPFTLDHINRLISIGAESKLNFVKPERILIQLNNCGFDTVISRLPRIGAVHHVLIEAVAR